MNGWSQNIGGSVEMNGGRLILADMKKGGIQPPPFFNDWMLIGIEILEGNGDPSKDVDRFTRVDHENIGIICRIANKSGRFIVVGIKKIEGVKEDLGLLIPIHLWKVVGEEKICRPISGRVFLNIEAPSTAAATRTTGGIDNIHHAGISFINCYVPISLGIVQIKISQ